MNCQEVTSMSYAVMRTACKIKLNLFEAWKNNIYFVAIISQNKDLYRREGKGRRSASSCRASYFAPGRVKE